ncbi:MaoC family dehydratase N-terminal domain-containing protein [Neobacillus sp. 3P2-tot-E-2]|uniref:FAS1-like dehydratase domain-containing protein n=1 Tax=Neobacillus sp. 3P2-tot-E-2 TaxID=3132212 RepID=UPI0039A28F5C
MKEEMTHHYKPFEIERGKIKTFAKVLGLKNSNYYSQEEAQRQGYRDVVAPPTFPTVIEYTNDHDLYQFFDRLQLHPEKVLHGEQSYEYYEEICAGDTISATLTVERIEEKRNMTFYYLKTMYCNQFNELTVICMTTLIKMP